MAHVLIILGSASDRDYFEGIDTLADFFGITTELTVLSAHRDADRLRERLARVATDGTKLIVAAAGMAAHLAGVCAAETLVPVIGVPLPGSALNGFDALLSTVQMPAGIPVATVAIGKAGARNSIVLAARMLALGNPAILGKLAEFKARGAHL